MAAESIGSTSSLGTKKMGGAASTSASTGVSSGRISEAGGFCRLSDMIYAPGWI
jgi:hypothetical protein